MCEDENGIDTESNANKMANIQMCMQLVRQYLKFSTDYFVKDFFRKFVGQFYREHQGRFCNIQFHFGGLQACAYFNPNNVTSDIH